MEAVREIASEERTIRLLDYDPELGRSLRSERRAEAHVSAQATRVDVPQGTWTPSELAGQAPAYGLLLLDGIASLTVTLDGVAATQLLGRGDLIPPDDQPVDALLETSTRWTVIEPLTVALLDERFLLTVRRWPELVAVLFERIAAQANRRAAHRALCQLPRVEDRVHSLLWYLAERWGRVTPQGVVVPLRLTHELIGELVGAKRPTVSLALKELEGRGALRRRDEGWLLERAWPAPRSTEADPS
jgi:CRP/FNR family cyclic AMP-dependent transcriptional regulator